MEEWDPQPAHFRSVGVGQSLELLASALRGSSPGRRSYVYPLTASEAYHTNRKLYVRSQRCVPWGTGKLLLDELKSSWCDEHALSRLMEQGGKS
jgi:hypothetical protein